MTIMRIFARLILGKSSSCSTPRWISTAAEKQAAGTEKQTATQPRKQNLLFDEVAKTSSNSSIADILKKWVDQGKTVKRTDIVSFSIYFRRRRNFHAALQLYRWMESSKLEMNNADQAIYIDLLSKTEGAASAEQYFENLHESQKTTKTFGALLSCYCREKALDKALEIFERIKVLNCASTLNYNNVLSLYYSMEQPDKVVSLVEEMEEKNIASDLYTYNLLINSYAALKNIDAIEEVLEKMKSSNKEPDLFTYGNLATIYFNAGLHDKANAFLGMMEKMKVGRNEGLYEAFRTRIKLYSEMNNLSGVNKAWEDLKSTFPTLSNTSYLIMLLALSKVGDRENLEKLFKEWEEGCSGYDFRLPNVLLEYYLSRDMIEEATSLYEKLANREGEGEPNLKALELFATICLKNCEIDSALKYLKMGIDSAMQWSNKWFPTDETINLFLNYFGESNDTDGAEEFIDSMKKLGRLDSDSSPKLPMQ